MDVIETNGQITPLPVELHATIELPCRCPICPESTTGVQWYRSSNSDAFIKDGKALLWWSGRTGSSHGYGIKEDFSMTIYNLTVQHDQQLYRCIVNSVGGADECTHDVKLGIYAKPDTSPVIEFIRETNGFNVTCSIGNVYPMAFPILTTKEGKRTASNISDGTYNTTVTHVLPTNEVDTTIECLYSNLNFRSIASLRIVNNYTIDQPEKDDTTEKNMTYTDFSCTPSGLWIVWIILIIEALLFIVIVYAIKSGRVLFHPALRKSIRNNTEDSDQDEQHGESRKEEERANSMNNMLLGKQLSCVIITLAIQITGLILLVAYLATARCSIVAWKTQEGNVTLSHKSPEMIF